MAKKQNLRIADEGENRLTLFRPNKNSSDEFLHLETENEGWNGSIITCMNLDFVQASELADALVRFSRKLKFDMTPDPLVEEEKVQVTEEPWGWGWANTPNTFTAPTDMKYRIYNTSDGS